MPSGSIQMQFESPVVLCFWDMNMSHGRAFCSAVAIASQEQDFCVLSSKDLWDEAISPLKLWKRTGKLFLFTRERGLYFSHSTRKLAKSLCFY